MKPIVTALPRRRRYPSDTTDTEWEILAALLPAPASTTRTGGHPETHPRREIVDAIRYLVDNGCKWRALPSDFPPFLWNLFCQLGPGGSRVRAGQWCSTRLSASGRDSGSVAGHGGVSGP